MLLFWIICNRIMTSGDSKSSTSRPSKGTSADDIFDAVLSLEEEFHKSGVQQGQDASLKQGFEEGKVLVSFSAGIFL